MTFEINVLKNHPTHTSFTATNDAQLQALIGSSPERLLGEKTAERFDRKLPFAMKLINADAPQPLQCHPNRAQAQLGFGRENWNLIPLDADQRNYRDTNHQLKLVCALELFRALKGFRPISQILERFEALDIPSLRNDVEQLRQRKTADGLKAFFSKLMTLPADQQGEIVQSAVARASGLKGTDFQLVLDLHTQHAEDIGVLSPLLLNAVTLKPDQAMFLAPGELYVYLGGVAVELTANSNNVVWGGLTDTPAVKELLEIAKFDAEETDALKAKPTHRAGEKSFKAPADEFALSLIQLRRGKDFLQQNVKSAELLLVTDGEVKVHPPKGAPTTLPKGSAAFIPAATKGYRVSGAAKVFRASIPN